MSHIKYSQSTLERLPEIVSLNHSIFDGMYENPPYSLEDYQIKLHDVKPIIYIAEKDGEIIGDIISFAKDDKWYVWILGVSRDNRQQGVANALLELQEKYAKEHGYNKVTVKVYNISKEMLRLVIKRNYEIEDVEKHDNTKHNAIHLGLSV
jgi:ribosomal protein S18 acetylase RimI-like enzyme